MDNIELSLSKRKKARHKFIVNMLYIAPALIFLLAVVIIPFLQAIPYSFTNWRSLLSDNREWVGLSNYKTLVTNERFLITVKNTFAYTVPYIILTNIIGLSLALLVKKGNTFNNFGRTIFFLPFTVSTVASAIVWNYVFVDIYSVITGNISPFGLSDQVMKGMVTVGIWRDMGYCMLIFIAGLLAIPDDYYEEGRWRTRRGASGLKVRNVSIVDTPCNLSDKARNIIIEKKISKDTIEFFKPLGDLKIIEKQDSTYIYIYDYDKSKEYRKICELIIKIGTNVVKVLPEDRIDATNLVNRIKCQMRKYQFCIRCTACDSICPNRAIDTIHGKYHIDETKCTHCKHCIAKFYNGCIMCDVLSAKKGF